MFKSAYLFINGEAPKKLQKVPKGAFIVCTDGAYNYLKNSHLEIDVVIGDLDSITTDEKPKAREIIHLEDQNSTDFEKALNYLEQKEIKNIRVYGATGKDHDHFLGNLSAALYFKDRLNIKFITDTSYFYFLSKNNTISEPVGSLVSLFPFPIAKAITTEGLKYPLKKEDLIMGGRLGTRNTSVNNPFKIYVEEGDLLLFVYPKK